MARYCSDCTHLNPNEKKGKVYKCELIGKHLPGNRPTCEKFANAYARRAYDKEKMYDEGKEAENESEPDKLGTGRIFIIIILVILIIITNIF